jgi:hypothetical protein
MAYRRTLVLTLAAASCAAAAPALAQVDRYGGYGAYPIQQGVPAPPARVLSWPGKTIPAPAMTPPQANGYGYGRYVQAAPAYGAQLQPAPYAQGRGAPPPPYVAQRRATMYPTAYPAAPQPTYAPAPQAQPAPAPQMAPPPQAMQMRPAYPVPAPGQPYYALPPAPQPAQGSTATAPSGVYPPNTVPPQLAYPIAPASAQPLVGQAPPTSIYAPPPQVQPSAAAHEVANPTDPRLPQRVAMNAAPAQGARFYSLHREFGLEPDPTPAPPPDGQVVQLVSPIDSGPAPNPDGDAPHTRTRQITDSSGKTVSVPVRDPVPDSPDP